MRKLKSTVIPFLILSIIISSISCKKLLNLPPVVNAGNDTLINLLNSSDSIQLTGGALDKDGMVLSFLWSQVSGPTTVTIATPGSRSTYVTGLDSGVYVFQLMATDNGGATGVRPVIITITAPKTYNLTLQPDQNPNEVHIWGNTTSLEGSFNGFTELGAAAWTYDGDYVGQRGLFKFDLSTIPANAKIKLASLNLYSDPQPLNGDLIHANSGFNNSMLIQAVTTSWVASTVKWNDQPTTTTTDEVVIPSTSSPFLDLTDVDVTKLVQTMTSNNSNNGFLIRLENEVIYNSRLFCSSFNSDSTKHPKLMIEYSK